MSFPISSRPKICVLRGMVHNIEMRGIYDVLGETEVVRGDRSQICPVLRCRRRNVLLRLDAADCSRVFFYLLLSNFLVDSKSLLVSTISFFSKIIYYFPLATC